MAEQFTNFAKTTLASGITDSATSISITDGTHFPTADFYIVLGDGASREIVHCASRSGTTITADLRGDKGTTATSHSSGVAVVHSVLAHHFQNLTYGIGEEIAYAERTTNATSTATSAASPELITGLSVTVPGVGRPVQVEFYCSARHATADFKTGIVLICNGGAVTPSQLGGVNTTVNTQSVGLYVTNRMVVPDGDTYTFEVGMWGATGTKTYEGSATVPMFLVATQR